MIVTIGEIEGVRHIPVAFYIHNAQKVAYSAGSQNEKLQENPNIRKLRLRLLQPMCLWEFFTIQGTCAPYQDHSVPFFTLSIFMLSIFHVLRVHQD